jgi:hypothetical protein
MAVISDSIRLSAKLKSNFKTYYRRRVCYLSRKNFVPLDLESSASIYAGRVFTLNGGEKFIVGRIFKTSELSA